MPIDILVVSSVIDMNLFLSDRGFKMCLDYIGVPYSLVLTDPKLSYTDSINSIVKTHRKELEESKYLMIVHQDIKFLEKDWGKKIIEWCGSLPDFGYAGVEGRTFDAKPINYQNFQKKTDTPVEVATCDGNVVIIPSKLFLEHHFDEQFQWYPVQEDYACWVRYEKKLKVYSFPLRMGSSSVLPKSTKCSGALKSAKEYLESLEKDYKRLLEKWNLKTLSTTTSETFEVYRKEIEEIEKKGENYIELIIVCSVTNGEYYKSSKGFEQCLAYIGAPYYLFLTNPNLTITQSYNSIVKTNRADLEKAKYIVFVCQDIWFLDIFWGKKILEYCNSLPDMGIAGIECKSFEDDPVNYCNYRFENLDDNKTRTSCPVPVATCDANTIIIPTKLFLEHQFDEQFPWFPFAEDYAIWVQFVKKLRAYSLPMEINNSIGPSKYTMEINFSGKEYHKRIKKAYKKLKKKWNLKNIPTCTISNRCDSIKEHDKRVKEFSKYIKKALKWYQENKDKWEENK